jgi:hypothetical protein
MLAAASTEPLDQAFPAAEASSRIVGKEFVSRFGGDFGSTI